MAGKRKKPDSNTEIADLASKVRILTQQLLQLRTLVDEIEDRLVEVETATFDERRVYFESDFDFE